jgi:hypothetical protein
VLSPSAQHKRDISGHRVGAFRAYVQYPQPHTPLSPILNCIAVLNLQSQIDILLKISGFQKRLEHTFSFFRRHSLHAPRFRTAATSNFSKGSRLRRRRF